MSKENPTNKQLVAWWMYTSIGMNSAILPSDAEELHDEISIAFRMKLSVARCQKLRNLLLVEVSKLKSQYANRVSEIVDI